MRASHETSDEFLTLQELFDARIIPVGKRTIVKFLQSGELPGANFKPDGGRLNLWRVKKSDAEEFVRKRFRKNASKAE
jgi:hypothetical protein